MLQENLREEKDLSVQESLPTGPYQDYLDAKKVSANKHSQLLFRDEGQNNHITFSTYIILSVQKLPEYRTEEDFPVKDQPSEQVLAHRHLIEHVNLLNNEVLKLAIERDNIKIKVREAFEDTSAT